MKIVSRFLNQQIPGGLNGVYQINLASHRKGYKQKQGVAVRPEADRIRSQRWVSAASLPRQRG